MAVAGYVRTSDHRAELFAFKPKSELRAVRESNGVPQREMETILDTGVATAAATCARDGSCPIAAQTRPHAYENNGTGRDSSVTNDRAQPTEMSEKTVCRHQVGSSR